jgi:hypothetical protein
MSRTRNAYKFKWWHGVIGLVGLSMVLGTVQAVAADRGPSSTRRGTYRGYEIEIYPGNVGWGWDVFDSAGNHVGGASALTSSSAWTAGQRFIDQQLSGAIGP